MKEILLALLLLLSYGLSSQIDYDGVPGREFETIFLSVTNGEFSGNLSGILIVNRDKERVLIDFQSTKSRLMIEPTTDEDSYYNYIGRSTSNKTLVEFKWFVISNAFSLQLNGLKYEQSLIDGACDMVIDGLEYNFYQEQGVEYLTLLFTKPVRLYHLETEKYITVQPNSYLLFTIKHNLNPKQKP